jgi:hypothetical protein
MATTVVIAVGLVMVVVPAYTHTLEHNRLPPVMLSFSIVDTHNAPGWCSDLSSVLEKYDVPATVFVTGWVADQHPGCVSALSSSKIDIGSQTYSYANLTSLDYTRALEEVRKGKNAVNAAGNLDSRLFKSPYGSTDLNTYSLLSRSGITADFSYESQYNKYEDGQFVKYGIVEYREPTYSPESIRGLLAGKKPAVINFDNSDSIERIDSFISELVSDSEIRLVNASELAGLELTARGESA